ncbi:MAG: PQQ-binding-like beta-propeller repeat protein, partial [Planctomycetota bacterium]
GNGRVTAPAVPTTWSAEENLRWRTPLPGSGASSPIVTADRVYLTAYTGYGVDRDEPGDPGDLARHLLAFDRATGRELWRASVPGVEGEDVYKGFITQHGYASSTPTTDGERVYVLFGKAGLHAYDLDGELAWKTDLGQMSDPAKWGDATSPIVVEGTVVVDAGVLGHHLVGVDGETGEIRWRIEDDGLTNSWTTPTVVEDEDGPLVLFSVPKRIIAVEPGSGEIVWEVESPLDDSTCASIVTADGKGYVMGTRRGRGMAFDCTPEPGGGDRVLWKRNIRSGICTPILVGGGMYWCTGGILMGADVETGDYLYRERLPRLDGPTGGFPNADYSSPVAVGDLIVQFTRSGESYVVRAGEEFDLVAHNPAFDGDESAFSSSPAVSNGELFVRSEAFLYCISAPL